MERQTPPIHSNQGPSDEFHPIPTVNPNQNHNHRLSLDSDIFAYIDQSLKSLIETNLNNNAINNNNHPNHMIQTTPFMPMVMIQTMIYFTLIGYLLHFSLYIVSF